jgi:hypothetical protein
MEMADRKLDYHEVYWPRGASSAKPRALAKRLQTLNGKTIAQLWDFLFRGDEVFAILEEGIRQRYPDVNFVSWKEFGCTHGPKEREVLQALPGRFKELRVDAVISGLGM